MFFSLQSKPSIFKKGYVRPQTPKFATSKVFMLTSPSPKSHFPIKNHLVPMFIRTRYINHILKFSLSIDGDFPPRNKIFSHFARTHAFMMTKGQYVQHEMPNWRLCQLTGLLPHASRIRNDHIMDLHNPLHMGNLGE